jgi:group I intron endonuclease
VGSTIGLKKRINTHRYRATCLESSIFYRSISKHGWPGFKFGILEYVDSSNIINIEQRIKTLLSREQYYLDNINPSLNNRKKASSPLGKKRAIKFDSL